jgi:hypothetical protein
MTRRAQSLDKLAAWVGGRAKSFEAIALTRDADGEIANRALEMVRKFIIEKGLILYGGQAIDFALRLKGSKIYPPHQIPDYDFFSPRNVDDAYELADRLVEAGFPNVSAIPAIHVQTMRVATDFIYVADISFAPERVFDSLPTVTYAGMRILHPDYQRTDMHLAFCYPFSNPPREDIFHRYKKDLERFRLFQKFYPLKSGKDLNKPITGGAPKSNSVLVSPDKVALHGFAGVAAMQAAFDEILGEAVKARVDKKVVDRSRDLYQTLPRLNLKLAKKSAGNVLISFDSPTGILNLASPWPDTVAAELATTLKGRTEWFAPYMDSRPLMAQISGVGGPPVVSVYSTRNRLLAVASMTFGDVRVSVATPQYTLLGFLYEAHVAQEEALRDMYVQYYAGTLALIEAANLLMAALRRESSGPKVPETLYQRFVNNSPFGLPTGVIGLHNWDAAYLIRLGQSSRIVGDSPPGVEPGDLPDLANVPPRYYPSGKHKPGEHPSFDYSSNPEFQRGGQKLAPAGGHPERSRMSTFEIPGSGEIRGSDSPPRRNMAKRQTKSRGTYLALFEELSPGVLAKLLKDWRRVSLQSALRGECPDLVIADGRYSYDHRLWRVRCGIKSRLSADCIANKVNLHQALEKSHYIPETVVVPAPKDVKAKRVTLPGDGVWIWRPEFGYAGKGVAIVTDQKALDDVWREHSQYRPEQRALLSRYLIEPQTMKVGGNEHKFHIRMYFLVAAIPPGGPGPAGKSSALYTRGRIANASKPYKKGDYNNPLIHDTHFSKSSERRFPRDYPGGKKQANAVLSQAHKALAHVSALLLPKVAVYPESKGAFEIFGVDVMVDAQGKAWLIEINSRPGFTAGVADMDSHVDWISSFLLKGVMSFVLGLRPSPKGEEVLIPCLRLPYL